MTEMGLGKFQLYCAILILYYWTAVFFAQPSAPSWSVMEIQPLLSICK